MNIKSKQQCRWDLVSLGEVMLRLDPGDTRILTAREFRAWEGGGEYNVARGLRRCFGLDTAVVTALADNAIGRLSEDLLLQGGVNLEHLRWVKYDGVGRESRAAKAAPATVVWWPRRASTPSSRLRSRTRWNSAVPMPCRRCSGSTSSWTKAAVGPCTKSDAPPPAATQWQLVCVPGWCR